MNRRQKKQLEPRKHPIQGRSTETVALILESAAHILEKSGYDGYSTNAIAARAGVSIGSLYQYFPGKDAITIALIEREAEKVMSAVKEAGEIDDWKNALLAMIDIAARHQLTRPSLARLLDMEEARLRPASGMHELQTILKQVLLRREGTSDKNLRAITLDIIAMTKGLTNVAAEQGNHDINELRERISYAIFGYLALACPKS